MSVEAPDSHCRDCWHALVGRAQICRCGRGHWNNTLWVNVGRKRGHDCADWSQCDEGEEHNWQTIQAIMEIELQQARKGETL